ncbi:MAG TPA: CoA-binding protein [Nitrososphaeraceae archaeon]
MDTDRHTDEELKKFYNFKNIAVVGMSKNEDKPSHFVPKYLLKNGYNIIPVNPTTEEILERKSYKLVSEIKEDVDIVDVFRKSEDIIPVVDDLLKKKGIKLIWLQKGIFNQHAEEVAKKRGIDFVYNRCMLEEHQRLFSERLKFKN